MRAKISPGNSLEELTPFLKYNTDLVLFNFDAILSIPMSCLEHQCPCPVANYLKRPSESLVITGYRNLIHGIVTGDGEHYDQVWHAYTHQLGWSNGRLALKSLENLVKRLGLSAASPLQCLTTSCQHLCHDECMFLAMISAIQHDNTEVLKLSCNALCKHSEKANIMALISECALILKACKVLLLPVPTSAIANIVKRPSLSTFQASNTVH